MRSLRLNIFSLYVWQAAQFVIPILTIPVLSRALGVEKFGDVAIALNFAMYFTVVAEWGFNLSATQQVARASSDDSLLRNIFWDTIFARCILASICLVFALILSLCIPAFERISALIWIASIQVVGTAITTNWFLQGLEKMVTFSIVSICGRIIVVPLTFLFVHGPEDATVAVAIQTGSVLLIGASGLVMSLRTRKLLPVAFDLRGALAKIYEGIHLFSSQAAVTLYSQTNVVLLGIVSGPSAAGVFNGADRIRRAAQAAIGPISTALFPRVSVLAEENPSAAFRVIRRVMIAQVSLSLCISLTIFFAADIAVDILLGKDFSSAAPILKLLAPVPTLVGINNVLGTQILLPFGRQKTFSAIIIICGLFNVACLLVLCPRLGALGAASSILITETLVTGAMAIFGLKVVHDSRFKIPSPNSEGIDHSSL